MTNKRKLKGNLKPSPTPNHGYFLRSTPKCKQVEMKNFFLRFPHLIEAILSELNDCAQFGTMEKSW